MPKITLILSFVLAFGLAGEPSQNERISRLTAELATLCPTLSKNIKNRTENFIAFTKDDCAISHAYLLGTSSHQREQKTCESERLKTFGDKLEIEINNYKN